MDKRREVEAAEAMGKADGTKKKKKATKKKAVRKTTRKRAKSKSSARKRLVWGVFNGNMKEEARFPYQERAAAEEKIEQLRLKSPKKLYFIQPIKEEFTAATAVEAAEEEAAETAEA